MPAPRRRPPRRSDPHPPETRPHTLHLTYRYLKALPHRLCNPPPAVPKVRSFGLTPIVRVQLEDVLNRKHLPPIGLKDFEEWLLFVEHTPNLLYFVLWLKDYERRYSQWAHQARLSRPRIRPEDASPYRLLWSPNASPTLADFWARAKATFLEEGAAYQLEGIPKNLLHPFQRPHVPPPPFISSPATAMLARNPATFDPPSAAASCVDWHNALTTSPHPDPALLAPLSEHVNILLRASLARFVAAAHYNVGTARALCGVVGGSTIGLVTGVLPMLIVMFTAGNEASEHGAQGDWDLWRGRWVRIVGFPGIWLGLTIVLAALHGVCMMIYVFGDFRQLRSFEMARPSPPASFDDVKAAPPDPERPPPTPTVNPKRRRRHSSLGPVASTSTSSRTPKSKPNRKSTRSRSTSSSHAHTGDESFLDSSSSSGSSCSGSRPNSITEKPSAESLRSQNSNSGSSTYSHPEGKIHFSRVYYDYDFSKEGAGGVEDGQGDLAGYRMGDPGAPSPSGVVEGAPKVVPVVRTAGFIPTDADPDLLAQTRHTRRVPDVEMGEVAPEGSRPGGEEQTARRGRERWSWRRRSASVGGNESVAVGARDVGYSVGTQTTPHETQPQPQTPVFDFDALPPRPPLHSAPTPASPPVSPSSPSPLLSASNPTTSSSPLPQNQGQIPRSPQDQPQTQETASFSNVLLSPMRGVLRSVGDWQRRQAEECARRVSVTAGLQAYEEGFESVHGGSSSQSHPPNIYAITEKTPAPSIPDVSPPFDVDAASQRSSTLDPTTSSTNANDPKVRAHWLRTRHVPAFASPITRIHSPLVMRTQWEIVVRSAVVAFVVTWAVVGGILVVPVHL